MRKWSAPLRSENVLVSRSESKSTGDISVCDTFSNQESLVSEDSVQVLESGLVEIKIRNSFIQVTYVNRVTSFFLNEDEILRPSDHRNR